jgi:FMN-dependent oxidoreductase (nitrilotriacetate monooxygenase family)
MPAPADTSRAGVQHGRKRARGVVALSKRELHFGAFLFTPGTHSAGWRHPEADVETDMDFGRYVALARMAERGLMDCVFFQDTAAVPGSAALDGSAPFRPEGGRHVWPEPATLLAALAPVTSHIGLIATATTTYNEPYNIARRFATIDAISGGRAGWNLVTSQVEDEAMNFGAEKHMDHGLRYERAEEFYDVVAGLWDSWDEGAFPRDKATGRYMDPSKVHFLNHEGKHFKVRGPLNVARSKQGRPVVAQAGSSEVGRSLSARCADVVFTAQVTIPEGQAFCGDLRERAQRFGRGAEDIRVLPGLTVFCGATDSEARAKYELLEGMISDDAAMKLLARLCGDLNIYDYPVDGPLPDLPPSNAARARQEMVVAKARAENLSIRQIARYLGTSMGHQVVVGTPKMVADMMEAWLMSGACDGFNLLSPYYPGPLEDMVELVVPELQRRGIYRTAYAGTTLRANLGVPVPRSRYG